MEMSSRAIRDQVEASLRALVPADYRRIAEGNYFLTLEPHPGQVEPLALWECDRQVRLYYGPGLEDFSFAGAHAGSERLKTALRQIVFRVRDILDEHLFAAQYKRFFIPMTGFFPIQVFETLRVRGDFVSRSWKGSYSLGLPEPVEA